jgi:hypothetical protein
MHQTVNKYIARFTNKQKNGQLYGVDFVFFAHKISRRNKNLFSELKNQTG